MKKNILSLIFFTAIGVQSVYAATATPSAKPKPATPSATLSAIDDLKERLATKVAELRQTQRKAIAGIVRQVTISTFSVEIANSTVKMERTDDIAVYQYLSGKRTKLTTDDIEEGDFLTVFGDYDPSLELLTAKVIFIQPAPLVRVMGIVTAIDRKGFTATIKSERDAETIVDIEKSTSMLLLNSDKTLVKGGFSKLSVGASVHIVGKANTKTPNRVSATRLIDLGNMTDVAPSPEPTDTTPTATPSATAKKTPTPTQEP